MTPRYGAVVTARGPDYGIYMLTVRREDTSQGWESWDRIVLRPSKVRYTTGKPDRGPKRISFSLPKNGWYEIEEPPE